MRTSTSLPAFTHLKQFYMQYVYLEQQKTFKVVYEIDKTTSTGYVEESKSQMEKDLLEEILKIERRQLKRRLKEKN